MTTTRDVKFSSIAVAYNNSDNPVRAVVEVLGQDHRPEQHRRKFITVGHLQRDGLMMRFVPADKVWITDLGWTENPLVFFRDHRISPTMKGANDFTNGMLAHLKLMESK